MKDIYGYTLEEIDNVEVELLVTLGEMNLPRRLAVLGLCRTIAMVGDQDDLDLACRMIDRFSEMQPVVDVEESDE